MRYVHSCSIFVQGMLDVVDRFFSFFWFVVFVILFHSLLAYHESRKSSITKRKTRPPLRVIITEPTACMICFFLPPATKLGQGYVFTGVCDSVHRGGKSPPPGPGPSQKEKRDHLCEYIITEPTACMICPTLLFTKHLLVKLIFVYLSDYEILMCIRLLKSFSSTGLVTNKSIKT